MSTTAAKIVLRQNDVETARQFSEMMGDEIKKKMVKVGDKEEEQNDPSKLYTEMDIRTLDDKKQLIIYQGWARRPIEADKQYWFNTDSLKNRKLPESAPLPAHLVPGHIRAMGYDEDKIRESQRRG
jgi:type IV secretory pathway TraG/TraD family ATPase VirD4